MQRKSERMIGNLRGIDYISYISMLTLHGRYGIVNKEIRISWLLPVRLGVPPSPPIILHTGRGDTSHESCST